MVPQEESVDPGPPMLAGIFPGIVVGFSVPLQFPEEMLHNPAVSSERAPRGHSAKWVEPNISTKSQENVKITSSVLLFLNI